MSYGWFPAGALLAAIIALVALRAHALTRGGAVAAFVVGTITFGIGGITYAAILLAFFLSSLALGRIGRLRKKQLTDVGKLGARDAAQVLANGGVATVCALLLSIVHELGWRAWLPVTVTAFAGAYAAATADTWGTEIGTLVRGTPRSIVTLRPIATGISGGITAAGSLAEVGGAAFIGVIAALLIPRLPMNATMHIDDGFAGFAAIALGGLVGAFADSVLGATVQELRRCPACERMCEIDPHTCGTPTRLVRGVRGFSNDLVNGAATLIGAVVAGALALVWYGAT